MLYPCPDASDIADVHALNRAFLAGLSLRAAASAAEQRLAGLDESQRDALSLAPFLLFSLSDEAGWDRAFRRASDLLDTPTPAEWSELTTAAIAFLWHLAKRDPYSARLFSGLSPDFCEQLAGAALVHITCHALRAGIRPVLRRRLDAQDWSRLIDSLNDEATPTAAWAAGIQRILLSASTARQLDIAACAVDQRHRAVAERRPDRRQ